MEKLSTMANTAETFHRYLMTLQSIPRYPYSITTSALLGRLEGHGIKLTERTLQRDLSERLSLYFPLICDDSSRPFRWSLDRNYQLVVTNEVAGYKTPLDDAPNKKAA